MAQLILVKVPLDEAIWKEKYSELPATENVFECLKQLNEDKFKGNIYLVSKLKDE